MEQIQNVITVNRKWLMYRNSLDYPHNFSVILKCFIKKKKLSNIKAKKKAEVERVTYIPFTKSFHLLKD
jgi:hypothetical protein